jgi:hypothetical protein
LTGIPARFAFCGVAPAERLRARPSLPARGGGLGSGRLGGGLGLALAGPDLLDQFGELGEYS